MNRNPVSSPGVHAPTAAPETPVKTPRSVKWVAAVGIPISLAAAAAVSFAGLAELGGYAGIEHPWLMPVAIDVYATTATLIAMLLPEGHRARRTAVWNARLGLAMSMSGNAVARALHLGTRGYTSSDAILTFIGAWPSFIVERLLHLQGHLTVADAAGSGSIAHSVEPASASRAGSTPGSVEPVEPGPAPAAGTVPPLVPGTVEPGPMEPSAERPVEPRREVPQPRSTPPAGRSRGTSAKRSTATVTSIVPNPEWPTMVQRLVADHGPEVPLAVIRQATGCSKSTASRLRTEAVNNPATAAPAEADTEPEREQEAS